MNNPAPDNIVSGAGNIESEGATERISRSNNNNNNRD
jgi:hypothetical protein